MKKIRLLIFDQNSLEIQVPILFPSHLNRFILKIGDTKKAFLVRMINHQPKNASYLFYFMRELPHSRCSNKLADQAKPV